MKEDNTITTVVATPLVENEIVYLRGNDARENNIMRNAMLVEVMNAEETDSICKHCGLPWSDHTKSWTMQDDLITQKIKANETLDALKFKKRDLVRYENKMRVLKSDIAGLKSTNDVYYKLMAKQKESECIELENHNRELDDFFKTFDIKETEQHIDNYTLYMNEGNNFLKNEKLTFLTLDQILDQDVYVNYLQDVIKKYEDSCDKLKRAKKALNGDFRLYDEIQKRYNYEKIKANHKTLVEKIETLLCKISVTRYYLRGILELNGEIKNCNDAINVMSELLQIRQEEQSGIESSVENQHSIIQDTFSLNSNNSSSSRHNRGFFSRILSNFTQSRIKNAQSATPYNNGLIPATAMEINSQLWTESPRVIEEPSAPPLSKMES
jgi:hypothetical protein